MEVLDGAAFQRFENGLQRRSRGTPVAYIRGEREFWSLSFCVGPGVLIPRPETELLVEQGIRYLQSRGTLSSPVVIHDCCTGTGAVGIAIAREIAGGDRSVRLFLSDVSAEALLYARENAQRHLGGLPAVRTVVAEGDLLSHREVVGDIDLVTANPPYLTEDDATAALSKGWGEPRIALAAGPEGLDLYPKLGRQAMERLAPGGALIVECGPDQAESILSLFAATIGYTDGTIVPDAAGRPRIVTVRKPVDDKR